MGKSMLTNSWIALSERYKRWNRSRSSAHALTRSMNAWTSRKGKVSQAKMAARSGGWGMVGGAAAFFFFGFFFFGAADPRCCRHHV